MAKCKKDIKISLKPLTFDELIVELGKTSNRNLEDYTPGASRRAVFSNLKKTAGRVAVGSRKHATQPERA